ncbi:MAG: hypothetical protein DMG08_07885 [Acidobacteria bacterium]|nr:MAG: hypothetical protein DMG08_07885 [Acidobacteriota bacterium]
MSGDLKLASEQRVLPGPQLPGIVAELNHSERDQEIQRQILWLIVSRAILMLFGLNLADLLETLPPRLGSVPFISFFNITTVVLTAAYFGLWWSRRRPSWQLYLQIGADLWLTTLLVAHTRGIESPFVSFYLLIIIYSSLTLGRNGAMIGAALCAVLYSGVISTTQLGLISFGPPRIESETLAFRISFHALGFFSVAFLGTYLSVRLYAVKEQLEAKTDSVKHLEKLNERIVSCIRSGLITTNLGGTITVFNSAAEEITEKKSSDVLETPVQSVIGEELWLKIQSVDPLKDLRPLRHEFWVTMPDGEKRFLGFSVSPLMGKEGRLFGYIIAFQDLTEIQRLGEEIRLKEKMAAIGRMAAGIAHEIRNPLTSIRGSAEVLRSRLTLHERDARLMDIMLRESDRLNKFVEDFLCFARPGKQPKHSVELVSLLRDTSTLLENNPEVRKMHAIILRPEISQIAIHGNPDQLKQVFWNLSQNALRAMPEGGTLTIQIATAQDGGARITFQDTGIGMTREEKENLFQPFHSGFKTGTGLGLSIVFQIMDDHKGRISYESEKGRGTTVSLYLPPQEPASKSAHVH